jgi:hypothetical protein
MNHDEILDNRAQPLDLERAQARVDSDDLVFALRDSHHTFSMDIATVLQCLQFAEQEGAIPQLPDDWWTAIGRRYKIQFGID